jgi:glucose/arabinose dehydrogenase
MSSRAAIAFLFCLLLSCGGKHNPRILVFSKVSSSGSDRIETDLSSIIEFGKKNNIGVDTTREPHAINEINLKNYDAIVFLNATPADLDHYGQADVARFVEAGGGQVVSAQLDSASPTEALQSILDKHPAIDYKKATTKRVPEENRFSKVVLKYNFDEPTEMAILPDGRIMFLERKGNVKLYDPKDDSLRVINTFNVWTKFEDGMLGLTLDPNFSKNNWLYIYYSSPDKSVNVLSRFVFATDKIDMSSEKQLLEVPTQRETCCHTGGSLAFAADGNLFLSTGDNTSPFESDGFSPSDERPGRSPFDAQKSSGNTNDLRGKILRIHPQDDGTYTIPDGNLFPKGEAKTKPEIYVMGCRNPYRISVDQKTGYLYWGEVGPDAGFNDSIRGPRGYDEVNQAQKAGYFGWPYFVGNNYAYGEHNRKKKQNTTR